MPAQAPSEKVRAECGTYLSDSEDRARIFEDDQDPHGRELGVRVKRSDHMLRGLDELSQVRCLLFVFDFWHVEDQRLRAIAVVPNVRHEVEQMQGQGSPVVEVVAVRER